MIVIIHFKRTFILYGLISIRRISWVQKNPFAKYRGFIIFLSNSIRRIAWVHSQNIVVSVDSVRGF
jgi:hypothetical protein